jgi:hypothetical protein
MEGRSTENRKICKACGSLKLFKDFVKCKSCQGGYTPRCRHCVANDRMIIKHKDKKERLNDDFLAMSGVDKESYVQMYLFLKRIGYDLTKPIAEQFAAKYNLKPKKRYAHKLNKYNPDSLGLV